MASLRLDKRKLVILVTVILALSVPLSLATNLVKMPGTSDGGNGAYSRLPPLDIRSLKAASNLVVFGTVSAVIGPYGETRSQSISTVFAFNVTSYVKGTSPHLIYVTVLGGTLGGVTLNETGAPLFLVGEKYVLFLWQPWSGCQPSPPNAPCIVPQTPLDLSYSLTGGVEGRYIVKSGTVYGYRALFPYENQWLNIDVDGVPLDQFLKQVTEA